MRASLSKKKVDIMLDIFIQYSIGKGEEEG